MDINKIMTGIIRQPQLYCVYLTSSRLKCARQKIRNIAYEYVLNLASKDLHLPSEMLRLGFGERGKPYIKDHEKWHFNLSHTDRIIVIVVSDEPIGIDVEKVSKADFRIAERFFTERENEYINEIAEKQDERFFEVWTKKEAYVKYTGEGLNRSLKSIDVFSYFNMYKSLLLDEFIVTICKKTCIDNIMIKYEYIG